MNKVEVHAKTKYSKDYDSIIDIETILLSSIDNKEKGIIFIDKDTIYSFPKIEKVYKELLKKDKAFNNYKIGYGVELTTVIDNTFYQVLLVVKNQNGLYNLYKIMNNYEERIDIDYILKNKDGILLGLIYDKEYNIDLNKFDYIEINSDIKPNTNKLVVYSNIPNSLFEGDDKAREILSVYRNINNPRNLSLYLDTEDTLKVFNNKEIVINNSNKLLDSLDNIVINDDKLNLPIDDFDIFEKKVIDSFNKTYSKPSDKMIERLNEELKMVKEMNYAYYFNLLTKITDYCKENDEPYLIEGYTNNSLIAYILGLTNIEPYNLPYELFYSNNLSINIMIDPNFYYKKLFKYIQDNLNLVKCRYGFKINKSNVFRVIKNYEIKKHICLDLDTKDYVSNLLIDVPIYNDLYSNSFLVLNNDLIPYEDKGTIYDYHDLLNSFIIIRVLPNENINYKKDIKICNNRYVYHLFRTIDDDIIYFNDLKERLEDIPNLWFNDLVYLLADKYSLMIEDDIFEYLKSINLDLVSIFNIINKLKENNKTTSKASLINQSYLAYSYVCDKYI